MLVEDRFREILKLLEKQRSVTVLELTENLNISESTIRRDLTELHKQGLLIKVHGGAVIKGINYTTKDPEIALRKELNQEAKIKIAQYSATLIQDNDFVYLDAGTTTELMINHITADQVVFVTNGIHNARKLVAKSYQVYLLGGMLKTTTEAVVGSETMEHLQKYNFTKGFFGTNGVDHISGFTTPEIDEALVKKLALSKCREAYMLCDSSKFNQVSSVTFAGISRVPIITNQIEDATYNQYEGIMEVGE